MPLVSLSLEEFSSTVSPIYHYLQTTTTQNTSHLLSSFFVLIFVCQIKLLFLCTVLLLLLLPFSVFLSQTKQQQIHNNISNHVELSLVVLTKMKLKSTKKRKLITDEMGVIGKEEDSCPKEMFTTKRKKAIDHRLADSEGQFLCKCNNNPLLGSDATRLEEKPSLTTSSSASAHHQPLLSSSSSDRQQRKQCSSAHLHAYLNYFHYQHHRSRPDLPHPSSRHYARQNIISKKKRMSTSVHRSGSPILWQSLLMVTLLCVQMATVHAMLDALQALFILTGNSAYFGKLQL